MSKSNLIPVEKMDWSARLAITSGMDLTDTTTAAHVCEVLHISSAELQAGVGLAEGGDVQPDQTINPTDYKNMFDMSKIKYVSAVAEQTQTQTGITKPSSKNTKATKAKSESSKPKAKAGRKGDKTQQAYMAVGYEPVSISELQKEFGVSRHVLTQNNRFDAKNFETLGRSHTKKDSVTGEIMIYRDRPTKK